MSKDVDRIVKKAHHEWIAALDSVEDAIFIHDKEFRILRCNKAYQQYAKLPFNKIISQPYFKIFPKSDGPLPSCFDSLNKSFKEEELKIGDTIFRSRSSSITDKSGKYLYSIHTLEDITKQKKIQMALKESELKFKMLFEGANDGILIADAVTKKFILSNARIRKMLGYTKDELLCLSVEDIHPAKDYPYVLTQFEKQSKGEIELAPELPVKRKDGTVFFADINSSPLIIS